MSIYTLEHLPIKSKWTMKLEPDERLSDELKASVTHAIELEEADAFSITRRLWFMGRPLPICEDVIRIWRTCTCKFTDVLVNEHPVVDGKLKSLIGYLEHHDSPDLQHWYHKGDVDHITGDVHFLGIFLRRSKTILTIDDCVTLERLSGIKYQVFRFFLVLASSKTVGGYNSDIQVNQERGATTPG